MGTYIIKRLLLIVPTLFLIMLLNFVVIQFAPGGPVEQAIANITGTGVDAAERVTRDTSENVVQRSTTSDSTYRGAQGLDPEFIAELEKRFGFDKPVHERFIDMMGNYVRFDFGDSFFRDSSVVDLVLDKMPVSISLGLWSTLLVYLISIPLGIRKAVNDGSRFDISTSILLTIGVAIPGFLFAVLLLVVFAGGVYFDWFPLRGLVSDGWEEMTWPAKIADYFWHLALPITAMTISGFASLAMLTKNSFLDQISQQYVLTARAKGLSERRVRKMKRAASRPTSAITSRRVTNSPARVDMATCCPLRNKFTSCTRSNLRASRSFPSAMTPAYIRSIYPWWSAPQRSMTRSSPRRYLSWW